MTKLKQIKRQKREVITVTLTQKNYELLREISIKTLKPMTLIVRELLESFLQGK